MARISRPWLALLSILMLMVAAHARADVVTDWNRTMLRAGLVAGTSPTVMSRVSALVQVAVFDAVNGIEPHFDFFHVDPAGAPAGASKRAAAVQAAYAMLTKLFGSGAPTPNAAQQATLEARRRVSLTDIGAHETSTAINSGIAWGQTVADAIFALRATDGFSTTGPFPNGTGVGEWRQTPNLPVSSALSPPGVGYLQFSHQAPWAIASPWAFRPGPPPLVTSAQYARDFNEVKTMGSFLSAVRTGDQSTFSLFWNSATVSYLWNSVALSLLDDQKKYDNFRWNLNRERHHGLLENARLFAMLNVAIADAIIGCWDAKYTYPYWRPITAIRDTADDGNPATTADPTWVPMFATPGHPEYPSGHSCGSGAAGEVLAKEFGNRTRFTMESDLMIGVTRSFRSFTGALEEVKNARIFAGIHFRTACEVGQELGIEVARYVIENRFQRIK